jgi:tetratricopeptide (TPR) repeat protein
MYYLLGASHIELDEQIQARQILEASLSMTPVYPEIYRLLILLCDSAGDTTNASSYERLYSAREREHGAPRSATLVSLARSDLEWGLYEDARKKYRTAVALAPDSASYRREYTELLRLLGDTTDATDMNH